MRRLGNGRQAAWWCARFARDKRQLDEAEAVVRAGVLPGMVEDPADGEAGHLFDGLARGRQDGIAQAAIGMSSNPGDAELLGDTDPTRGDGFQHSQSNDVACREDGGGRPGSAKSTRAVANPPANSLSDGWV